MNSDDHSFSGGLRQQPVNRALIEGVSQSVLRPREPRAAKKGEVTPAIMLLITLVFGLLLGFGTVALRAQNGGGCCGAGGGGGGGDTCNKNRPEKFARISVEGSGLVKGYVSGTIGPIAVNIQGSASECQAKDFDLVTASVPIGRSQSVSVAGNTSGYGFTLSLGNHQHNGGTKDCCDDEGELYIEGNGQSVQFNMLRQGQVQGEGSECQNEDCDCPCRPYEPPPPVDCPDCVGGKVDCVPCERSGRVPCTNEQCEGGQVEMPCGHCDLGTIPGTPDIPCNEAGCVGGQIDDE